MDRNWLENVVEAHFRARTSNQEVRLESTAAPLNGASIESILVNGTHVGYVLTDTDLREGHRSSTVAPKPELVKRALGKDPLFIYVEPDREVQDLLAGPYRAVATDPHNILAGTDLHVPSLTQPRIAQGPTRETNYIAIPEFTRGTPTERLISEAGIAATYVLADLEADPQERMREVTFTRAPAEQEQLRYRSLVPHKTS